MVNTYIMCNKHLLGEHNEIHKAAGNIRRKRSITGYIENDCLEPRSMETRHRVLVWEMERRGFNHKSPFEQPDLSYLPISEKFHEVNSKMSLADLLARCPKCKERYDRFVGDKQKLEESL